MNDIKDCEKFLLDKNGLRNFGATQYFRKPIEKMLNPYMSLWDGDREMYYSVLRLIGISDYEIARILHIKFVYDDDGNWDPINKLNANQSDISVFVLDVMKHKNFDLFRITEEIKNKNHISLKLLSMDMNDNSVQYYQDFLLPNKKKYTKNIVTNTISGDNSEKVVLEFLKNNGYEIIYHASEGSPIDTKLGIDIIAKNKDGLIEKIQVKTVWTINEKEKSPSEEMGQKFTHKLISGGYSVSSFGTYIRDKHINRVAYVDKQNKMVMVKKYSPVSVENGICEDKPTNTFPSSGTGYFFIDYESVTSTNII